MQVLLFPLNSDLTLTNVISMSHSCPWKWGIHWHPAAMRSTQNGWQQDGLEGVPETSSGGKWNRRGGGNRRRSKTSYMPYSKKTHRLSSQNLGFFPNSLKQLLKKHETHLSFKLTISRLFLTRPKEDGDNKKGEDFAWNQSQESNPGLTSDTGEQSWLTAGSLAEIPWSTNGKQESGVGG